MFLQIGIAGVKCIQLDAINSVRQIKFFAAHIAEVSGICALCLKIDGVIIIAAYYSEAEFFNV